MEQSPRTNIWPATGSRPGPRNSYWARRSPCDLPSDRKQGRKGFTLLACGEPFDGTASDSIHDGGNRLYDGNAAALGTAGGD